MTPRLVNLVELPDDLLSKHDQLIESTVLLNIQNSSSWFKAYAHSYLKKRDDALFFFAEDSNELAWSLPLQLVRRRATKYWKRKVLQILGKGPTDFYSPAVLPGFEQSMATSLSSLLYDRRNKWDSFELSEIPTSSDKLELISKNLNTLGFDSKIETLNGFRFVDTTQSWDEYFHRYLKSRNKDLLKDQRRIEREGITLEVKSIKRDVFRELQKVLTLYKSRRENLNQKDPYEDTARLNFVREITTQYESSGNVELSLLKDQYDNVWAFQLDWLKRGTRYHWNHAYNEDFKRYSPGKILLYLLMKRGFERPEEKQCNHMRGLAPYKERLADQSEALFTLKAHNPYSIRNGLTNLAKSAVRIRTKVTSSLSGK